MSTRVEYRVTWEYPRGTVQGRGFYEAGIAAAYAEVMRAQGEINVKVEERTVITSPWTEIEPVPWYLT